MTIIETTEVPPPGLPQLEQEKQQATLNFNRELKLPKVLQWILNGWEWITDPVFLGMHHLPTSGPALFVGNHSATAVLDAALLQKTLYLKKNIFLRGLGDHLHFKVPFWGDIVTQFGGVDGTPENCARLMDAQEYLLVFPGGAHEAFKNKGEEYQLLWKKRVGFARLAIRFGCPIIPFAVVGGDDSYEMVMDRKQIMASPVGTLLRRLHVREDLLLPVMKGVGLTLLPRPQRFYFKFSAPILTQSYHNQFENKEACWELREQVKRQIEQDLAFLLEKRTRDPEQGWLPRLARQLIKLESMGVT